MSLLKKISVPVFLKVFCKSKESSKPTGPRKGPKVRSDTNPKQRESQKKLQ